MDKQTDVQNQQKQIDLQNLPELPKLNDPIINFDDLNTYSDSIIPNIPYTDIPNEYIKNFIFGYKPEKRDFWKMFGNKAMQEKTISIRNRLEITNHVMENCGKPLYKMPESFEYIPFPIMCRSYNIWHEEQNKYSFNKSVYQNMLHLFLNYEEIQIIMNGTDKEYDDIFGKLFTNVKNTMNIHMDTFPQRVNNA